MRGAKAPASSRVLRPGRQIAATGTRLAWWGVGSNRETRSVRRSQGQEQGSTDQLLVLWERHNYWLSVIFCKSSVASEGAGWGRRSFILSSEKALVVLPSRSSVGWMAPRGFRIAVCGKIGRAETIKPSHFCEGFVLYGGTRSRSKVVTICK